MHAIKSKATLFFLLMSASIHFVQGQEFSVDVSIISSSATSFCNHLLSIDVVAEAGVMYAVQVTTTYSGGSRSSNTGIMTGTGSVQNVSSLASSSPLPCANSISFAVRMIAFDPFIVYEEYQYIIRNGSELILPVNFIGSPQVEAESGGVRVDWTVAQQLNNEAFLVQHRVNGESFKTVSSLPGERNEEAQRSYSYFHAEPEEGHNYYRILQVDFDGVVTSSPIVQIKHEVHNLALFPNPASESISISLEHPSYIRIYDLTGGQWLNLALGTGINDIDISHLPPGVFVAKLPSGNIRFLKR